VKSTFGGAWQVLRRRHSIAGKRIPVPIATYAGSAPESVWSLRSRETFRMEPVFLCGTIRTLNGVLTEMSALRGLCSAYADYGLTEIGKSQGVGPSGGSIDRLRSW
jgi:hypothetical protein